MDTDTQDGKDGEEGGEKEAEMYENVFRSISLKDATHRVHQNLRRACAHIKRAPDIVIGFVPLVLSRHAVIVRHAIITIL